MENNSTFTEVLFWVWELFPSVFHVLISSTTCKCLHNMLFKHFWQILKINTIKNLFKIKSFCLITNTLFYSSFVIKEYLSYWFSEQDKNASKVHVTYLPFHTENRRFNVIWTENAHIKCWIQSSSMEDSKKLQQMPGEGIKTRTCKYFSRSLWLISTIST